MKLGVVGLPNVGKSTLFNAITNAGAQAENYPFCTIEPNTGVVPVPDHRLDVLAGMYHPKKVTPAVIEFVDIAGLVKGASRGEGLGNKFLSHIRETDAIVHVVRCFDDDNIIHVDGSVDPARDIDTINLELIFADMDTVQKRREKAEKSFRGGDKNAAAEAELAERLYAHLESGKPARTLDCTEDEKQIMNGWFLLTTKPVIYAANIAEDDLGKDESGIAYVNSVREVAEAEGAGVIVISAAIEQDIASMSQDEKKEFLEEMGIGQSGLDRLITASYKLLGLISFLTAGEDECRAWTIVNGTKAPQAAGKIHTDFEKGFIRAEIVPFDTLAGLGSMAACREKGLVRSRLLKMDWKAMWKTTGLLKKRSGRGRVWLMTDMLRCGIRYNAGYIDYKIAQMYRLSDAQRKTVITRGISNDIVRRMNPKEYWHTFDDKAEFNSFFSEWIPRRWIRISDDTDPAELYSLCRNFQELIGKPIEGSSGVGIRKYTAEDWKDGPEAFLEKLRKDGIGILEEIVVQHPKMASLCPTSVNTCRIATLLGDKQQGIVYAFLRIGNGKVMDNVDCGGMASRIDLETGRLLTVGADKQGNTFIKHPMTDTSIIGFQIPYWKEAKQMCMDAAQKIPQMRFIAWDVAITEKGPTFIEGNSFPSHAIPQFAAHYPDGIGILPEFEKFIDL